MAAKKEIKNGTKKPKSKLNSEYDLEHSVIKEILSKLIYDFKSKWTNEKEVYFTKGKTDLGSITLNNTKVSIKGEVLIKEFDKLHTSLKNKEKNKVTDNEMNSFFSNFTDKKQKFNGLEYNKTIFNTLVKELKGLKIDKVLMNKNHSLPQTISNDVVLGIECSPIDNADKASPSGYYTRLRNFLFTDFKEGKGTKEQIPLTESRWYSTMTGEKPIDILINDMIVGQYFKERNFISLFFNPFLIKDIKFFDSELPTILTELIKALKGINITKIDTSAASEKIFLEEFLKNSKKRKKDLESEMASNMRSIQDYENSIRNHMENYVAKREECENIEKNLASKGKSIFEELDKAKKLSFVESIELGTAEVKIKYKPSVIPIAELNINGNTHGKRFMYVGAITFTIKPGSIRVSSDAPLSEGNGHPHCTASGEPCFGGGNGSAKIYEALASNQFVNLAKLLWFWIQVYRDANAYVHTSKYYQDRLEHGYPVFTAAGKRIELGDKDEVKAKIQLSSWSKKDNYAENIKKFKGMKMSEFGGN